MKYKRLILLVMLVIFLALVISLNVHAQKDVFVPDGCELLRCTCYIPTGNKTATGITPYEGICASNKDHLGQVAVVYDMDLQIIGYFECKDTGSHQGLKDGTRIDIFRENKTRVKEWQKTVGDYVIVQWVKGEG